MRQRIFYVNSFFVNCRFTTLQKLTVVKHKSSKRKKPPKKINGGSWLEGIGTLLIGIAAVSEVVFKIVVYLLG